jgi:hypothetical protein
VHDADRIRELLALMHVRDLTPVPVLKKWTLAIAKGRDTDSWYFTRSVNNVNPVTLTTLNRNVNIINNNRS